VSTGDRVALPDGRAGFIVGWQGVLAIVALDSEETVTVERTALRRMR
jgi:hypothetical protein